MVTLCRAILQLIFTIKNILSIIKCQLEKELTKYNTKDDEYTKIYNKLYNLKNKDKISNRRKQSRIELKKDKSYYNYLYFTGLITLFISTFIYSYY